MYVSSEVSSEVESMWSGYCRVLVKYCLEECGDLDISCLPMLLAFHLDLSNMHLWCSWSKKGKSTHMCPTPFFHNGFKTSLRSSSAFSATGRVGAAWTRAWCWCSGLMVYPASFSPASRPCQLDSADSCWLLSLKLPSTQPRSSARDLTDSWSR